jgi:hypothetical protein
MYMHARAFYSIPWDIFFPIFSDRVHAVAGGTRQRAGRCRARWRFGRWWSWAVAELGPNFWGGKMGWGGEKMGFRLISGNNLAQYI